MTPAEDGAAMKLPNAENAYIPPAKIVDYLLSMESRRGRSKAKFFMQFGFSREQWQIFAEALQRHAASYEVVRVMETEYGPKFTVEGPLMTPDGRDPQVRTTWMIRNGSDEPSLLTAHPLRR